MRLNYTSTILPQTGTGIKLNAGDVVRIIDIDGQQVADLWAIDYSSPQIDWLSTSQTRDINERLFPSISESFYSDKGIAMMTLIEDNSPCPHDMLFPACNQRLYESVGLQNHPNCRDNFLKSLKTANVELPIVPDPVNLFQNSPPQKDGKLEVLPSYNPPLGNVLLKANIDLLLIVTACSVDYHPTNGDKCTAIKLEVYSMIE